MIFKTQNNVFITVIIAVFNGEETLERCIASVINQTYPHKELIIMDGDSADRSVEIIKIHQNQITYWESQKDRGLAHAWNKALDKATGDWIYFLGADDYLWENNTLEQVADHLGKVPKRDKVVYGKVIRFLKNGKILDSQGEPWQEMCKQFLNTVSIHHQSVFHHKSLFEEYGYFDEAFRFTSDYELLLRYLKQNMPLFIDVIIAGSLLGGMANQSANRLSLLQERTRAIRKLKVRVSMLRWSIYYLRVYIRILLAKIIGEKATDKLAIALWK